MPLVSAAAAGVPPALTFVPVVVALVLPHAAMVTLRTAAARAALAYFVFTLGPSELGRRCGSGLHQVGHDTCSALMARTVTAAWYSISWPASTERPGRRS